MISGTYLASGILLIINAQLFTAGVLNAATRRYGVPRGAPPDQPGLGFRT
jgi:hypothetical protein